MRLISYNLMNGGEGRADPIAEVLLGRAPDVVGVHEATNDAVLRRLGARLRMDFVVAESRGGRVAIFSRFPILDTANLGAIFDSAIPILDATLDAGEAGEMSIRVAHLLDRAEAMQVGQRLAERSTPHAMLMSYEPPMGKRVIDGVVVAADAPVPATMATPVRQLDEVLTARDVRVLETWAEQDRLAYYASDHLPSGVALELAGVPA